MNRKDLAEMLEYAADLMEVLGEGGFRAKAYRSAARHLEQQDADLGELAARGFKGVPGIGPSLAPMLSEIVQSQEFAYLAELEGRVPPGVLELFRVQGLGPKRIRALWDNGVGSLEELVLFAEEGRIRVLPGFGVRSEASLLEAARYAFGNMRRLMLPVGLEVARLLLTDLHNAGLKAELAGSVRRGLETISNLDLVAVGSPEQVRPVLGRYVEEAQGSVLLGRLEGLPLRVFCSPAGSFGSVLVQATGSQDWLATLGTIPPSIATEEEVFKALNQPFVPAYWREKEHIGLPAPHPTLQPQQLRGLIHVHSTYSDGSGTLRQMAEAAIAHGFEYMAICDHSQAAAYAGGLRVEDVMRQWDEIKALNTELAPFQILRGIESDILLDGSLDYPDEVLVKFEVVVGSLHAGLGLGKAEQTQRLLRALENPYLSILGHPSGRLILQRKGVEADWEEVLERAQQNQKIVEFNCSPYRLDLDWRLMLAWRGRLNFSLSPDSHSVESIQEIQYGLLFAHKAGLHPSQIANTWPAERLVALKKMT